MSKNYRLNLHAEYFGDKRTKRMRTKSENKRKAILESIKAG